MLTQADCFESQASGASEEVRACCQPRLFQPDDPLVFHDEPDHAPEDQCWFHDMVRSSREFSEVESDLKTRAADRKAGDFIGSAKTQDLQ